MNKKFLKDIEGAHILVAGEVGLDQYIYGDIHRISPEAPVPVVEVTGDDVKFGLAANVANNIMKLGAAVSLVSVRGNDPDGRSLDMKLLCADGMKNLVLLQDDTRPTIKKVRVVAQQQHVVRIDYEKTHPLSAELTKRYVDSICDLIPSCDGVIVQDYGKGLWTPDSMQFLAQAKAHKCPVFVDPSRNAPVYLYNQTTLLTPNIIEAEHLSGLFISEGSKVAWNDDKLKQIGTKILLGTDAEHVIITCGEAGMVAMSRGNSNLIRIPTFARSVFDVTGAGDTVVAVVALMYTLGYPLNECMQVANAAAGIVVGKVGTASVIPYELQKELERLESAGHLRYT